MWIRDGTFLPWIRDRKNSDPGSSINIPDPQHLNLYLIYIYQCFFLRSFNAIQIRIWTRIISLCAEFLLQVEDIFNSFVLFLEFF
jgi:hypothetical protein